MVLQQVYIWIPDDCRVGRFLMGLLATWVSFPMRCLFGSSARFSPAFGCYRYLLSLCGFSSKQGLDEQKPPAVTQQSLLILPVAVPAFCVLFRKAICASDHGDIFLYNF